MGSSTTKRKGEDGQSVKVGRLDGWMDGWHILLLKKGKEAVSELMTNYMLLLAARHGHPLTTHDFCAALCVRGAHASRAGCAAGCCVVAIVVGVLWASADTWQVVGRIWA